MRFPTFLAVTLAMVPLGAVDVSVAVTDGGAGEPSVKDPIGNFRLTRTGITTSALTVTYILGGTATNGLDYSTLSGNATFVAEKNYVDIRLTPLADELAEPAESVVLTVVAGVGYVVGTSASATINIQNAPFIPMVTVAATDTIAGEPSVSGPIGNFRLTRTGNAGSALTVSFAMGGTASNGTDYSLLSGNVTFVAGKSYADVRLTPLSDALDEPTETAVLTVVPGSGYGVGAPASASVAIYDADYGVLPVLSLDIASSDLIAGEPNQGSGSGVVVFRRSGASCHLDLPVNFTVGGTAGNGIDYTTLGSSATIPAGSTGFSLVVSPKADTITESDETVVITLVPGVGYTLGTSLSSTVIIKDMPETTPKLVSVSANDATATEPGGVSGNGAFQIVRSGSCGTISTISFSMGGTAINGTDYTLLVSPITLGVGSKSSTISVTPKTDAIEEPDETVILNLTGATNATINPSASSATVTITGTFVPNQAPVISLPSNLTITTPSTLVDSTIADDSGVAPTIAWSGPVGAPLKISNGATADPMVLFAKKGTYRLTVTATDAGTPPLATTKTIDVTVNATVFSIAGKVLDDDVPTSPATAVQLTWLPLSQVINTVNTSTIDGSFSFADLIGLPTDFQVTVPRKL